MPALTGDGARDGARDAVGDVGRAERHHYSGQFFDWRLVGRVRGGQNRPRKVMFSRLILAGGLIADL